MATKITAIQGSGTWEGQYGLMYKFEVTLEDGTVGQILTKSENQWKVGDEVECTVTKDDPQYGKSLKLSKPQPEGQRGGYGGGKSYDPKQDHNRQVLIMLQSNMKIAFDLANNFGADDRVNVSGDSVFAEAERLTEMMLNSKLLQK